MNYVLGISGISGAGKSTLASALATALDATLIAWDDFDEISVGPADYVDWYQRGEEHSEWDYPVLAKILESLKSGVTVYHPVLKHELIPTKYIVFDAPLGKMHEQTGKYIDCWIHISVQLDVALARRLIRDFKVVGKTKESLISDLEDYLDSTHLLFFDDKYKEQANYVLDGMLPVDDQVSEIKNVAISRWTIAKSGEHK